MKNCILCLWCIGAFLSTQAQNTDLPAPVANLQTLPAGSYVIAMDNALQQNSAGNFNLKAYGLIVYLLNNNVRIKWCIKAGKVKDGIDFTAVAEQVKPIFVAGASRDFKAGPFIISVADTSGVSALTEAFYAANSLTGLNCPRLYRLTADAASVDLRYNLAGFRPKAAVLTDGGNQNLHLAYLAAAAIPPENYAVSAGTDLISNCFTFASEPHNKNTGTAVNNAITSIRDFVSKGGNFLAQCDAVENYENNSLGRFQTTTGITVTNTNIGTTLAYGNPDLSFSQFEGAYNASAGGSVKNWKITGSATNNQHYHATGTGTNTTVIGASVSKHFYDKGGLVFYIGNHSFSTTNAAEINGIRMYMNAFLTPSNTNCPVLTYIPLPVRLLNFTGGTRNKKTLLSWEISDNELADHFLIEKSKDGWNFSPGAVVAATDKKGKETYQHPEPADTKPFYRLTIIDKQGKTQYSPVLVVNGAVNTQDRLTVLNNSVTHDMTLGYHASKEASVVLQIYNALGSLVYKTTSMCSEGLNILVVPQAHLQEKGLYYAELTGGAEKRLVTKAVRL